MALPNPLNLIRLIPAKEELYLILPIGADLIGPSKQAGTTHQGDPVD
jgi:hypothetical protein